MDISELLSTPGYVCDNCHHNFGRSTTYGCTSKNAAAVSLRLRASFVTCVGIGSRGTGIMSRAISEGAGAAISPIASSAGTSWLHRERCRLQRESVGTQDQLVGPDDVQDRLDQLLESDDRHDRSDQVDDFDTDNPTQHDYIRDQVARDDDDYAHDLLDQLLLTGDDELSDIVAVPRFLELEHQDNDDHQASQGAQDDQVHQENGKAEHVQAHGHQESSKATGRDGVSDCVKCLDPLDGETWLRDQDSCRQPYHHECIKRTIPVDPRCSNCRAYVHLEVEDDEVIIVRHVAAPPTCVVCLRDITGVVLEGPQCSHTVDYECLVAYNAQYLRNFRARDLQCPACSQPFQVPGELSFRDEENDEGSEDNAFEYEEPDEELEESEVTQDDGDNSVVEYHASDWSSSSDSDEDYAP
ncbi:hypothetical protein PInf_008454 [Phytophthora infestans]|nr:hypothetical protein PInf_008454 [Phytophthora infestans]